MTRSHPMRPSEMEAFATLQAVLSAPTDRDRDRDRIHYSIFVALDGATELLTSDNAHWAKWRPVGGIIFSKNAPAPFRELAKRIRNDNG